MRIKQIYTHGTKHADIVRLHPLRHRASYGDTDERLLSTSSPDRCELPEMPQAVFEHDKTDKSNTRKVTKEDPKGRDHRGCVVDHDILEAPLRYLHHLCHRFRIDHIVVAVVGCSSEMWGFDPRRGGRIAIGRMDTTTQDVQQGLT